MADNPRYTVSEVTDADDKVTHKSVTFWGAVPLSHVLEVLHKEDCTVEDKELRIPAATFTWPVKGD